MKKVLLKLIFLVSIAMVFSCKKGENNPESKQTDVEVTATSADPLPSWNEGELKNSIISFVKEAVDSTSKNFIPQADRIATFDNDGTLWAEKPLVQELFAFYQVKKMVAANPALASKQPFKAVVEKDMDYFKKGGEKALIELVIATHTGMTEDEFEKSAKDFMATEKCSFQKCSFQKHHLPTSNRIVELFESQWIFNFHLFGWHCRIDENYFAGFLRHSKTPSNRHFFFVCV